LTVIRVPYVGELHQQFTRERAVWRIQTVWDRA
jgi:hypothetical protein